MSVDLEAYRRFLEAKVVSAPLRGFQVTEADVNQRCKPHVRAIVPWMVQLGRAACFSRFGLQKTVTQLEAVRLTRERAGGRGLIVCPLGVRQEFRRDAVERLGWPAPPRFIRSIEEAEDPEGLYLTNYETVREGKLDPNDFTVASLDEAAVLRGFGGTKTFREFMALFAGDDRSGTRSRGVPYRFVATAMPSPNDFIELLAYAAYLDVMDVSAAKTRFFKRDSTKADHLTLHPHKRAEFWGWISTWACFVQKPSDICQCPCHSEPISRDNGSAGSLPGCGFPSEVRGDAPATAEASTSPRPTISSRDGCSVAVVSVRSMGEREPEPTTYGSPCTPAAETPATRTGPTTEAAESGSVTDGPASQPSLPTWVRPLLERPSNEPTTPEVTSPETAGGLPARTRRVTPDVPSSLRSADGLSPLPPGPKISEPATGSCTAAGRTAGPLSECSETSCDSCRCDEGYILPPLDVRWHEVPTDHSNAGAEKDGQVRLYKDAAMGVQQASREKRDSLPQRIQKMLELRAEEPDEHRIIWHDLEAERAEIEGAVPGVVSVYGSQDLEEREAAVADFADGRIRELAAKPVMLGAGTNLQRHCARAIYLGIGFKLHDFVQSLHRLQRYGQTRPVRVDLIYTEAEREVRRTLERKWRQHEELVEKMAGIIREHGLAHGARGQARTMGVTRVEASGPGYRVVNNDAVLEVPAIETGSVGLIVTSIPFAHQYEYSPSFNDFGHTDDFAHFWRQMDFLTPELLRVLQPGRVAAVHVKDRITPGGINGFGFQTVHPLSDECVGHFTKHGFAFLGRKTIVTDVVRENAQTYRLGWTEQCKDGSRMGVGLPEYVLLFRKPQTDRTRGFADLPVVKSKASYSRGRWQFDAHGFARSNGDRPLSIEDLKGLSHDQVFRLFRKYSLTRVYDFEQDVAIAEWLDSRGMLPPSFMLLQPQSWHPDVWTDITRMRTLNTIQAQRGAEMHLCPLQFDLVRRLITQLSMEGELVFDPFAGLGTVPYCAVQLRRRGLGVELSSRYFADSAAYCAAAAHEISMPSLFDLVEEDARTA